VRSQGGALALAQAAREVDDGVAAQRSALVGQGFDDLSSVPVASSAWATWRARVWPKSGVSSGAVTKSLPPCGVWPNLAEALA